MKPEYLRRLLNLFPVKAIRANWEEAKGRTKSDVVDAVVAAIDPENVIDFARKNVGLTKQHVYLFAHQGRLANLPQSVFEGFDPKMIERAPQRIEYFYLLPLAFRYVAGMPPESGEMIFLWPIKIIVRSKIVEVHVTTMEKDISSYLPEDEPLFDVKRTVENDDVLANFKSRLRGWSPLSPLDINKGVKTLWEQDAIDAPRACWKKAISTSTETMDAEFLVKKDAPAIYAEAIKAPLLKTVFKTLDSDVDWPEFLVIDPSNGELAVSRYGESREAVDHVIGEILRNN